MTLSDIAWRIGGPIVLIASTIALGLIMGTPLR